MSLLLLAEPCPPACPRCGHPSAARALPPDRREQPLPFESGYPGDTPRSSDDLSAQATPRSQLPDPARTAHRLVQALLEVLAGDRPARQLARCTTELLQHNIEARVGPRRLRPWAGSVRSVHVCEPSDGVAEVSAVVAMQDSQARGHGRTRCRAVALRLEGLDGRWVMTALMVG